MNPKHPDPKKTEAEEDKARTRDPHGTAPAEEAGRHEPAGAPRKDRHDTETATGKTS